MDQFKEVVPFILYCVGIIMCFVVIAGKPKYGLMFFIFLVPLQNVMETLHQFPAGKDFNDILIGALILGWIIAKNANREPVFQQSSFNPLLITYALFTYFALWMGSLYLGFPSPFDAADPRVQDWKNYMVLLVLFFLTLNNISTKKDIKQLLVVMCCSMFFMNTYTLRQISWITSWTNREKIGGTFAYLGPNEVAAFYSTYTFVLIGVFLLAKEIKARAKIALGFLIFQNIYCILFLLSRAAYCATLLGSLFFSFVRKRILIVPIILILLFWQALLPPMVVERIQFTHQDGGQLDTSAQRRLDLWGIYLDTFKQSPVVGVGFSATRYLNIGWDAHNVYVRTLADMGIVGLLFMLFILLLALRSGWRLFRNSSDSFFQGLGLGFCCCVVAVAVGNFFGDRWSYLQLAAYFWVFLAMVERGNLITQGRS